MIIPDTIEPEIGFRVWEVMLIERMPVLASPGLTRPNYLVEHLRVSAAILWPYREALEAECYRHQAIHMSVSLPRPSPVHDAPGEHCHCGVYIAADELRVERAAQAVSAPHLYRPTYITNKFFVIGTASLWGKIVPGTMGWRGEYCYPKSLDRLWYPAGYAGKEVSPAILHQLRELYL